MTARLRSRTGPRRGTALLAALALLVTISLVALELGVASRASRLAAANALDRAAADAVARAGLTAARARLLSLSRTPGPSAPPGAPAAPADPWALAPMLPIAPGALGALRYEVTMRDAGAALDVNRADEAQLRRLLLALGLDAARADHAAGSIADWRDGDELRRGRGAERADYLQLGRPVVPANAPFRGVDELRDVVGIDAELFAMLRPYVTTRGGVRVNLNAAEAPVLAALPGMSPELAALVLRRRARAGRIGGLGELANELSAPARERLLRATPELLEWTTTSADAMDVTVVVRDAQGTARARLEALVVRESGPRVAWWRVTP